MNLKDIAKDFLQLVIAGKIDEAYKKYVDMRGKHHNVYFPAGFPTLKEAMKENHKMFPNRVFEIRHCIVEDNIVTTHSRLVLGDKQMTVVHIFRFEKGKIIEMWDVGQEIPQGFPNKDGAF
jgi:predicted SnoaL-like aldol condensation-catalyzing enzyme